MPTLLMLVALILHRFSAAIGTQAAPLSFPHPVLAAPADQDAISSCNSANCRSIWDIVWSCLVIIFSCTWVAIHPNIPSPNDSTFTVFMRRTKIMLMALIAPELVIMWAIRQSIVANTLVKERAFREHEWTKTHMLFALMGGFMLYDGKKPVRPLPPKALKELADAGTIDFPVITEAEIKDRSKGDLVSKGLVIIQTSWFVLQCCARGVERLPITELEIVTLAYAVLNFATYFVWWNKPLNVQCPYRVQKKSPDRSGQAAEESSRAVNRSHDFNDSHDEDNGRSKALHTYNEEDGTVPLGRHSIREHIRQSVKPLRKTIEERGVILSFTSFALGSFNEMARDYTEAQLNAASEKLAVPIFYAGSRVEIAYEIASFQAGLPVTLIATVFGAIHVIAWNFTFPSSVERELWRIFALIATCSPTLTALVYYRDIPGLIMSSHLSHNIRPLVFIARGSERWANVFSAFPFMVLGFAYILARLDILVQSLLSLRALPPGALDTIRWITNIPHV